METATEDTRTIGVETLYGQQYIVERRNGLPSRVAGPMHHEDPTDPDSLSLWLDHAETAGDAIDDAVWWFNQDADHTAAEREQMRLIAEGSNLAAIGHCGEDMLPCGVCAECINERG